MKKPLVRVTLSFSLSMTLLVASQAARTASAPACAPAELAYVGTDGSQLRALRFDACTGKLAMIGPVAELPKARWAVAHPSLPILYVAHEGAGTEGGVAAFAVSRGSGALTKLGDVASGGSGTTHLWLDQPSMTLLAANFSGASTSSIALQRDGALGALVSTVRSSGSGPHRRQAAPHPHGVAVDPAGRYALVSDMGADRVFVHGFDRASRVIRPDDAAHPRSFTSPPGSGPRRTVFGASGRHVHVLLELSAEIITLQWDGQNARLSPVQTVALSSADFQGVRSASEMVISQDGQFIYVGNRGENQLQVFRVSPMSGELSLVQRISSGGEGLWHFEVHASGLWMLVANYRSNRVQLFRIDPETGLLSETRESVESSAPVSVTFVH